MNQLLRYSLSVLSLLVLGSIPLSAQSGGRDQGQDEHTGNERHPACGTFLYAELESREGYLNEKEQQLLNELKTTTRLQLDRNIVSRNGHFRIHYDVSGSRAPSLTDANGNDVPDYIDSVDYYMEFAWQKEIEELGFITPPQDNPQPGSGGVDGRIDVYITELSGSIYGLAYPDADAQLGSNRIHGYLHLDNDYKNYPTPGIAGLRVTTAHEFHHIVQFASYRYDLSQGALYEATSTWMEFAVHPDVNDYRFYFNALLKEPQGFGFSTHNTADGVTGYAHMNYLQSLVQQLNADIVKSIWSEFKNNGRSFDAINSALLKTGSGLNLANSFCTFAHWSYYTGVHAIDTPFFARADQYQSIVPAQVRKLDEAEDGFIDALMPLSFGVWRLTIPRESGLDPDTIDFLVTNSRSDVGVGGPQWLTNPEAFTLDVSTVVKENYLPLAFGTGEIFYHLTAPHQDFCVKAIINGSPGIVSVANPTPQPFYNDGADRMVFAVNPGAGTVVTNIHLDIYSTSMTHVTAINRTDLETLENLRGVVWDGRDERGDLVPSGVYIYTLSINGSEPSVGKFAVVKR